MILIDGLDHVELAEKFRAAKPFPHILIEPFLQEQKALQLVEEFPLPNEMPRSRDYLFGAKRELSSVAARGPASKELTEDLLGEEFARFLSILWGGNVHVDPAFHGGGFHQGTTGSFLDMHADFNVHPSHATWHRVINVLIYLSPEWRPEWDGRLLLTDDLDIAPIEIEPAFNRAVIMETSDRTYHGYRRLDVPVGVARRSIAAYAYEVVASDSIRARTTVWKPDGNSSLTKRLAAAMYVPAVRLKGRFFSSRTARNR